MGAPASGLIGNWLVPSSLFTMDGSIARVIVFSSAHNSTRVGQVAAALELLYGI
jgi:hypothetical protein